jgi:hypothetical protein
MRTAIAAPAEWPTTTSGASASCRSSCAMARAMPGSDSACESAPSAGMPVKPCPGKSMPST